MNDACTVPGVFVSKSESRLGVGTVLPCVCALIEMTNAVSSVAAARFASVGADRLAGAAVENATQVFSFGMMRAIDVPFSQLLARGTFFPV